MRHRLQTRQLYIVDLARRLHEMESGRVPMHPMAYRVIAKRLRQVLAAMPWSADLAGFAELPDELALLVADMLEVRHFNQHGRLFGDDAEHCRAQAQALIGRLQ